MYYFKDVIIPILQLVVLAATFYIYYKLLVVTDKTLKFTKKQTSFNIYFDNYKLYSDLSKRKTSIVLDGEVYTDQKPFFENMTFENIHFNYAQIFERYPLEGDTIKYEIVFKRFNYKIQSFIDIILKEVTKIKKDTDLTNDDRTTLLDLYKNFLLSDYINLCDDLKQIDEMNKQGDMPIYITNFLKFNYQGKTILDIDKFFVLYKEIRF